MARVFRIEQKVTHTITVLADSLDDANMFADDLGDDDFSDQDWGSTKIVQLPKKVTNADVDITEEDDE